MKHITKIWLGVCLAGVAMGWMMGSPIGGAFTEDNWQRRLMLRVALTGIAPLVAATFALRRNENHRPARLLLIVLVTAIVMTTSWGALLDLAAGPRAQRIVVAETQVTGAPRYSGGCCTNYRATLADGRRLTYDTRVADRLPPGPYEVMVLDHDDALLSVLGTPNRGQPPATLTGRLFLVLGIAITTGAFALAWRAGRRERFVRAALDGHAWRAGRSSAFTVYFAMLPQKASGAATLVPTSWFCYAPAEARLDTVTGPLQLDLQGAAYGVPLTGQQWRQEHVESELRALGCQRASSLPTGVKPPRGGDVWQRSIPDRTALQVFARPNKPLLLTDGPAENRPRAIGYLAAAAAESVATHALVGILGAAFVVVSGYAFLFL
jgi:hypothetical protein